MIRKPYPLLFLLSIPAWFGYTYYHGSSYLEKLFYVNPYKPGLGQINLLGMIARTGKSVWLMVVKVLPQIFFGVVVLYLILTGLGGKDEK